MNSRVFIFAGFHNNFSDCNNYLLIVYGKL